MASPRHPITCHVLDTVKGAPATGIPVTLSYLDKDRKLKPAGISTTDRDGRITLWERAEDADIESVFAQLSQTSGQIEWILKFEVEQYFQRDAFWSDIEIKFKTQHGGEKTHWHVPLLLSPWSYTTYRGS